MLRSLIAIIAVAGAEVAAGKLNPLEWVGANSPWFPGPNVFGISTDPPASCEVDQAVWVVRHGSRYPDPDAYEEWLELHEKISSANFTANSSLSFLPSWKPVLSHPAEQIAQESITGYRELYNLGTDLRFRYPTFYADNTPFTVWANYVQRVVDTARLFSRGYAGPNSSFVDVLVINSTAPGAFMNSLAPVDACPSFSDDSDEATSVWDAIYLPPITKRLQTLIEGDLVLTDSDVSLFPYLCGFESQITGRLSPFCGVFEDDELKAYEYRQDLRYWYGTGPGSVNNALEQDMMLPLLSAVSELLRAGPNVTFTGSKGTKFTPPPLVMAFTHDNQINELASLILFDSHQNLTVDRIMENRTYISSRITPMRGSVTFERLSCGAAKEKFVRMLLNDAVYPVTSCQSGPGQSCPLADYVELVQNKAGAVGNLADRCGVANSSQAAKTTFFTDMDLPIFSIVKP